MFATLALQKLHIVDVLTSVVADHPEGSPSPVPDTGFITGIVLYLLNVSSFFDFIFSFLLDTFSFVQNKIHQIYLILPY